MAPSQRIEYVSVTPVPAHYLKELGKNAYADNWGQQRIEWVIRARTNDGAEGYTIANRFMRAPSASVAKLIQFLEEHLQGTAVDDLLTVENGRVTGGGTLKRAYEDNGWLSILSFDLYGKAHGVSAVDLLGGRVRDGIPAYDTTMYFQDFLVPENGAKQAAEEAAEAVAAGWRAIKIKTGRGGRWMMPEDGMRRDTDVVDGIREAAGPDVKLMVDGNNGYNGRLDLLEQFVREIGKANVFWMEEMVTENVEDYRRLRNWRDQYAPDTLIVDGEGHEGRDAIYWQLMEDETLDAIQPDMLHLGFWPFHRLAQDIEAAGYKTLIAPHNYNTAFIGLRGDIQFGAVTERFVIAEDSTLDFPLCKAPGYEFRDGSYAVPDAPGLGIEIDQDLFEPAYRQHTTVLEK